MRRILLVALLGALLAPVASHAAGQPWPQFKSTQMGFSVSYPKTWKVVAGKGAVQSQVLFVQRYSSERSVSVMLLPITVGSSIEATLKNYKRYQRSITGSDVYSHVKWTKATLGRQPARVGILKPPTEGGVTVSNAVYVAQSHTHVYQITLVTYRKRPAAKLSQFPHVYQTILNSWRFL